MPTIVATATGKNTISAQMTTLPASPGPNHRAISGARARIGVACAATRYGRQEPLDERAARQRVADDERRARHRPRSRARPRRASSPGAAGSSRPTTPTNQRATTVPGGGRMNGGKPLTITTSCQTSEEDDERRRERIATATRLTRPTSSPRWRRISRAVARDDGGVEVGDRPRPWQLHGEIGDDAPGPRRQDDDPVGDEDRLGDAVGDQHDRRARRAPRVAAARGRSVRG